MTLRVFVLWTVAVFALGWFGGAWYSAASNEPDDSGAPLASAPVAPAAPNLAVPAADHIHRVPNAPAATGSGSDPMVPPPAITAGADPAASAANLKLNQDVMDVLMKMTARTATQETIDFQAQVRSEPWATEVEARITAAVQRRIANVAGARLARSECRTTICQAEVVVPNWATELTEFGTDAGGLHESLASAGLDVSVMSDRAAVESDSKKVLITMRPGTPNYGATYLGPKGR